MEMLKTIGKAWKVTEIRKKIIFTLLMLLIFRIGSNIPVPNIDRQVLAEAFGDGTGIFALFNLFSGGAFAGLTIFALSITPYITASIIMQLLTMVIPALERMAREGNEGRKKMARLTRYLTIAMALIQAIGISVGMFRQALISTDFFSVALVVLVLTAGTAFLMWLGEKINDNGIGNGISLIIFAGIIAALPSAIGQTWVKLQAGEISVVSIILFAIFAVVVIVGIILIQEGQRRIPVQYAKRVVGRKMYGGQATHIPLKVNQAGVIPVIFAMSLMQFPLTITYFMNHDSGFTSWVTKWLSPVDAPGVWLYSALTIVFIVFFTFFYTTATFNPIQIADDMKANGGFIPGIRPGRATIEYLQRVSSRLTIVGGLFLALIATLPMIIGQFTSLNVMFGGTSLLIAVGVALDTMKQLEQQLLMRNYQGFLK